MHSRCLLRYAFVIATVGLTACGSGGSTDAGTPPTDTTASDRAVVTDITSTPDASADATADVANMDVTHVEPAGDTGINIAVDAGMPPDVPSGDASVLAANCTGSGGLLSTAQCCNSASDFPATCAIGACGCGPSASHTVIVCVCPGGCWNGTMCQGEGGGF